MLELLAAILCTALSGFLFASGAFTPVYRRFMAGPVEAQYEFYRTFPLARRQPSLEGHVRNMRLILVAFGLIFTLITFGWVIVAAARLVE